MDRLFQRWSSPPISFSTNYLADIEKYNKQLNKNLDNRTEKLLKWSNMIQWTYLTLVSISLSEFAHFKINVYELMKMDEYARNI